MAYYWLVESETGEIVAVAGSKKGAEFVGSRFAAGDFGSEWVGSQFEISSESYRPAGVRWYA